MAVNRQIKKTERVCGHCPVLDSEHYIKAEYIRVEYLGDSRVYAKFMGFTCEYSHECKIANSCPLIEIAEKKHFW